MTLLLFGIGMVFVVEGLVLALAPSRLEQALALLARHGALAAARGDALDWVARARTALAVLPPGTGRGTLVEMLPLPH